MMITTEPNDDLYGCESEDTTEPSDSLPDPAELWPHGELPMVGRYQVIYQLGRGSHGIVFAALDHELERPVALKLFADDRPQHEVRREAAAMARSRHANVVALHDIGRFHCLGFLVMELIRGANMWEYMCSSNNTWRRTVSLFIEAARGLEAVHQAGFAHGDVKPWNLMIGRDDHVYIADFSVARALDRKLAVVTECRAGTREYQAPERLRGAPADERADQFSLCVSLWQAIYCCRPWTTNEAEVMAVQAPAKVRRSVGIPKQLERVLLRGLALDPAGRFESMGALAAALSEVALARHRGVRYREVVFVVASLVAIGLAKVAQHFTGWIRFRHARQRRP